jgi:uncharacterized membrane protein YkvA (DUF1232 family)
MPAMDLGAVLIGLVVLAAVTWLLFATVLWLHRPSRDLVVGSLRMIPDLLRLVRALAADDATPRSARLALGGLLIYLVSPIDLVPDFLPGIGSLDDLIVAGLVLRWVGRRVGSAGLRSHWPGTPAGFEVLERLLGL